MDEASKNQQASQSHGAGKEHGPKTVRIQVQTPRGLWSMTAPADANLRPEYALNTKVATVIADARAVFKFVEQDSKYTLFLNGGELAPERPIESYHVEEDALFVLSVQGGNA